MSRILVVDDEAIITMLLEERLTAMGYSVVGMAASGEEAVEKTRRLTPDLVLMDIVMPGKLNGIDAARIVTEDLDIPVVFVTSYADDTIIRTAKSVRPYGYIVKPFNELELKAAIEVALFRKTTEKEEKLLQKEKNKPESGHEGDGLPEYYDLPGIQTLLLNDIFRDILLFLYTSQTPKEPIFKFFLEEAQKQEGCTFFSYYHSTLGNYFRKEIKSRDLITYRIKKNELHTLIPVLEKCTTINREAPVTKRRNILIDFSDATGFPEIIAVKNLLLSTKESGVPVSGIIALDIGEFDHNQIGLLAEGIHQVIVATGKETMLSFAHPCLPPKSISAVPQSTIEDVVKKLLEPVVLSLLERPKSGYEIVHEIYDRYNVIIPQARVYTILYDLEKQSYLTVTTSGKSKLYGATEKGREYIDQRLNHFAFVLQHILGRNGENIQKPDSSGR